MKRITDKAFRYTPSHSTNVGRHLEAHKKNQRICAACEPWFDTSAFNLPVNVANLRKISHG